MGSRYVSIWFRHLKTDWMTRKGNYLAEHPFVLAVPDHGRMMITAVCPRAEAQGVSAGMAVADARAIVPSLQVFDEKPGLAEKLLRGLGEWCIRYTPVVSIDLPDGLFLDATGCAYLWNGERSYLQDITGKLKNLGYIVRAAMADTAGAAWAMARYGKSELVVDEDGHMEALRTLPSAALRLDAETVAQLHKLGLRQIGDLLPMPRTALRRRFGTGFLKRLDETSGRAVVFLEPIFPIEPYQERLPCLEPIITRTGIEIALERLLETLCKRLRQESKGLRTCVLKGFRTDGKIETVSIGTSRASHNPAHLFRLFHICLDKMDPGPGIELFLLEAQKVEDILPAQEQLWSDVKGLEDPALSELLDRIAIRFGSHIIQRFLPDEHYWPERSTKTALSLDEQSAISWKADKPRPIRLLEKPEPIEVTAPIPDYPPMLFRYRTKLHKIVKADGPERIEQEWWLQQGAHRDYYTVEDEQGQRYWLFRLGHYTGDKTQQWFLHGFFA
jgi:protein ImuB